MRAFIALPLPDALQEPVAALQDGLEDGRVVPEDDLHITLAFLGDVQGDVIADIADMLERISAMPVPITLDGVGGFGDDLRSLHLNVRPEPELVALAAKVKRIAEMAGATVPRRRFTPHVTLMRRTPGPISSNLNRWIAAHAHTKIGPEWADEVVLFQSDLTKSGPIYTPLAEGWLGADLPPEVWDQ
jgi:2'-5' RNA ligase